MSLLTCWQKKQVINVCDGHCLGTIKDLEIDSNTGQILSIIVPDKKGLLGLFGFNRDYVVPWCDIRKIGDDVIMVDINGKE
ncbi:MAG: YlmC/YmxH family sporulation protein [Clostridia bacterium]|nr:YlmC/YmxH family sporulation protein [Clostridia bacterium]